MTQHANGPFDVKVTPQKPDTQIARTANLGRLTIDKRFHGDLEASAKGEMLATQSEVKGSAGYVALERVTGKLQGRAGSFVLLHSATLRRGTPERLVELARRPVQRAQLEADDEGARGERALLEPGHQAPRDAAAAVEGIDGQQVQVRGVIGVAHDGEAGDGAVVARSQHHALGMLHVPADALGAPRRPQARFDQLLRHRREPRGIDAAGWLETIVLHDGLRRACGRPAARRRPARAGR